MARLGRFLFSQADRSQGLPDTQVQAVSLLYRTPHRPHRREYDRSLDNSPVHFLQKLQDKDSCAPLIRPARQLEEA